jgi:hypothetical protein
LRITRVCGYLDATSSKSDVMASMSTAAILDRLRRDGHGELVTAVRERQLSAYGAACLAGYFKRKAGKLGSDNRSRRRLYGEAKLRAR